MVLQPSRRDVLGPPPRDVTDLAKLVRHHESYLRSLDPGILGGRFATPRPVEAAPQPLAGDSVGGEGTVYEWEWSDRLTVTATGTQTFVLSHEPVDESLVIRWHPDAGAPVTQINEHWTLEGQVVTIPDPAGDIEVGDLFSAQYQYDPGIEDDPPAPATATFRAGTTAAGGPTGPALTGLALPTGTQIGDLIVLSTNTSDSASLTVTDHRLTAVGTMTLAQVSPKLWLGFATDLSDIAVTANGSFGDFWSVACITLVTDAVGWGAAVSASDLTMVDGNTLNVPQTAEAGVVVCGISDSHDTVHGACTNPTGYTNGAGSGTGILHARASFWDNAGAFGTSPAGPTTFSGGDGAAVAFTVALVGPSVE